MRDHYDAIYGQDFGGLKPTEPYGWIQWKGTNVCIDLHCACGTLYAVGQQVKLIALTEEQAKHAEAKCDAAIQADTTA